jgi:hypothetical protein
MTDFRRRTSVAESLQIVAGLIIVALLAACGGDGTTADGGVVDDDAAPTGETSSGPEPALSAEITWGSFDRANGTVKVSLMNHGTEPVQIDSVRLDAPPYSMEPPDVNESVIDPERRTSYGFVHGDPACDGLPEAYETPMVEVGVDGGQLRLGVGDSADVIERLLNAHCAQQRVAEFVSVGLGTDWTFNDDESQVTGTLVLERTGRGPAVSLIAVRGSVIFGLHPVEEVEAGAPLVVLEPEEDVVEVPLMVKAARCDPHALADSKNTYTLQAWLALDDEPEVFTEFSVDRALRPTLDRLCL